MEVICLGCAGQEGTCQFQVQVQVNLNAGCSNDEKNNGSNIRVDYKIVLYDKKKQHDDIADAKKKGIYWVMAQEWPNIPSPQQ